MGKKNPILQKKFDEGYQKGLEHGSKRAVDFFIDKFNGLDKVPGIGEKTMEKIVDQLGHEYFREVRK